jgi:cyclin-dependent kinase 9
LFFISICREVFKARCKKTNDYVAMKLILMDQEKEGFPITALREIKILQELRHDNIVRLIEVCRSASKYSRKIYFIPSIIFLPSG